MLLAFFFVCGWIEVPILLRPSSPDERVAPAKFYGPSVLCPHVKKLGQEGSVQQSASEKWSKLGGYGAGTLWLLTGRDGAFATFNGLRLAKRASDKRTWVALAHGWKVTSMGRGELQVQHNGSEGVIVSLFGGMR
jgi:hypothetical protein